MTATLQKRLGLLEAVARSANARRAELIAVRIGQINEETKLKTGQEMSEEDWERWRKRLQRFPMRFLNDSIEAGERVLLVVQVECDEQREIGQSDTNPRIMLYFMLLGLVPHPFPRGQVSEALDLLNQREMRQLI